MNRFYFDTNISGVPISSTLLEDKNNMDLEEFELLLDELEPPKYTEDRFPIIDGHGMFYNNIMKTGKFKVVKQYLNTPKYGGVV